MEQNAITPTPRPVEPPEPEALLAHAGALRSLARGLLRDPQGADDLVQETWLRALEQPPASAARLGGWLRAVLRGTAYKRARGEARRRAREERSARVEPTPSTAELAERKRALRAVSEAVLALEEPYQSAILLRYYEELAPAEIARRQGVPVATVKSRLQRGLAKLRARLDEEAGGRRAWSCALASLTGLAARPEPWVALGPGAALAAAGVALATLVGLVAWTQLEAQPIARGVEPPALALEPAPPPERAPAEEAPGDEHLGVRVAAGGAAAPLDVPARAVVGTPAPERAPRERCVLALHVVGADGLPAVGVEVLAGPLAAPRNRVDETDLLGELLLPFPRELHGEEIALEVRGEGGARAGLRRVELERGEQLLHLALRIDEVAGEPEPARSGEALVDATGALRFARIARGQPYQRAQLEGPGEWPDARWHALHRAPAPPRRAWLRKLVAGEPLRVQAATLTVDGEIVPLPAPARLRGRVRDADGRPAPGASLLAQQEAGHSWTARADADGRFELRALEPGALVLLASGAGGSARRELTLDSGAELDVELALAPAAMVEGRLVDERGAPLAGWTIELDGSRELAAHARADAGGRFALPQTGDRRARLLLHAPGTAHRIPAAEAKVGTLGRAKPIVVRDEELPRASLAVELAAAERAPLAEAELVLWHAETGRGARLAYDAPTQRFRIEALPAGRYELAFGAEGSRWSLENLRLRPGEAQELRGLRLEAPAELTFGPSTPDGGAPLAYELDALTGGFELRVAAFGDDATWESFLPAGRYRLTVHGRGTPIERVFALAPGERARLELDERLSLVDRHGVPARAR